MTIDRRWMVALSMLVLATACGDDDVDVGGDTRTDTTQVDGSGTQSTGTSSTSSTTGVTTETSNAMQTSSASETTSTPESSTGEASASTEAGSSESGMMCAGEFESCATGEACCAGLSCCSGGSIPRGEEYCSPPLCPISDRNRKENFAPVDPAEVLAKVATLPITTWNYTFEDASVRHIGPMAQDFEAAMRVGATDDAIFPVDADGVVLASIQALDAEVRTLHAENAELKQRLAKLEARRDDRTSR